MRFGIKWTSIFFCPLFLFCTPLFAQEEQELIQRMEQSSSAERILALSIYSDGNVFSKGRTAEKFDFLLKACYRIAERDKDQEFIDYLGFYARIKELMFIPIEDLQESEVVVLKRWKKELSYYESTGEERFIAICLAQLGESYFLQKRYGESVENLLKAKTYFQKVGYQRFPMMGRYLHQMALIFYFFREYDVVVELMNISVQLPPHNENYGIQRYTTLGAAYMHLKQDKKAEEAFLKTIETAVSYHDDMWIAIGSGYLASLYIEQGKYQEALHLYESTLKYTEEVRTIFSKEYSEHLLGAAKAHILLNQLPQAQKYLAQINFKEVEGTRAQHLFGKSHQYINYWLNYYDVKHRFHRASKNYDQAYFYSDSLYKFKYLIDSTFNRLEVKVAQNRIETQKKQFENDSRESIIKSKNQLLILFVALAIVVAVSALLLFFQNRKVRSQNSLISRQMGALQKIVDQKQVLLKELQHRVKNNLQHVISILEIQKESVDFSNIDELVRENQNRIHSMALLHNKLNSMEDVNMVNLKEYLTSLSGLVKDSYGSYRKDIELSLYCETEYLEIEKALPIGLIMVELISNSIKHAFEGRDEGAISIAVLEGDAKQKNILHYKDDGKGFDFTIKNQKGLGLEIIKGLIDQLNGRIEINAQSGFEMKMYF